MKLLLAVGVLSLVAGAAAWWWLHRAQAPHAVTAAETQSCRDACEQNAIVEQRDDAYLAACRARCGGEAVRKWEPIERISVAPADHRVDPRFPRTGLLRTSPGRGVPTPPTPAP